MVSGERRLSDEINPLTYKVSAQWSQFDHWQGKQTNLISREGPLVAQSGRPPSCVGSHF
jgi:hypothetical protein